MARPIRLHQLCVYCMCAFHPSARLKLTVCAVAAVIAHRPLTSAWLAVADPAKRKRIQRLPLPVWQVKEHGFRRSLRRTARRLRSRSAIVRKRRRLRLSQHRRKKLERVPSRPLRRLLLRSRRPRCRPTQQWRQHHGAAHQHLQNVPRWTRGECLLQCVPNRLFLPDLLHLISRKWRRP
jgi:hypothetical protein